MEFHSNLSRSFFLLSFDIAGGTIQKNSEEGEKTGKEKLFDTFMTLFRHDGAT
jgi:hypothetical protein